MLFMPKIYSQREYAEKKPEIAGAVIYDGDGDGTSAASIWLMQKNGNYLAITNKQKYERALVKEIFNSPLIKYNNLDVGVFDISAEQNMDGLKRLVDSGAKIDLVDHHTRISLQTGINNYTAPDSREVSSAYLSFQMLKNKNLSKEEIEKAIHLAVVGLANDGKISFAKRNFSDISEENIGKLCYLGKSLNYASNKGNTLDFVDVLRDFSDSKDLLNCFSKEKFKNLANEMNSAIENLTSRISKSRVNGFFLYAFPDETEQDKILSQSTYQNFLDEESVKNPLSAHIGILQPTNGKYRVSIRGQNALELAKSLSKNYNSEFVGRETAAGFDTTKEVKLLNLESMLESI